MTSFLIAIAVFLIAHSLSAIRPLRAALVDALGLRLYLAAYSLLSIGLLAWVIVAALNAPYVELWGQPAWAWHPALTLAGLGVFLAVYGLVRPNPLSVSLNPAAFNVARPGLIAWCRHPVMIGFVLWGLGHLLINGDVVLVILFGAMTLFAAFGMKVVNRRIAGRLGADHVAALLSNIGRARRAKRFWQLFSVWDAVAAAAGIAAVLMLLGGLHLALFGADPLAGA
ncbi:hypothetical protein H2509_16695 [Stappia sp. F7233]|uniref:NnrU domain-containing protein n=1 Tax=Stappia albiluteola TaxID=2758565 RepID=A0A839AI06_9HYPH|nr:NnrU family protein [Stappia albiluteola]MBA5778765.1 hypothetical protein [Stappia albiluteola]